MKININQNDLYEEVCGSHLTKSQIQANVYGLIQDFQKTLSMLKNTKRVLEYESHGQFSIGSSTSPTF